MRNKADWKALAYLADATKCQEPGGAWAGPTGRGKSLISGSSSSTMAAPGIICFPYSVILAEDQHNCGTYVRHLS